MSQTKKTVKDRAEELSLEELEAIALRTRVTLTARSIENWLLYPYPLRVPRVLAGPKGVGKTFAAMDAVRMLMKHKEPPCFYVYKRLGRVEDISWKFRERVGEPWGYIFDDVHYLAEAVFRGEERVEVLTSFMRGAVEKAESGRPVVVISEDMPSLYFEKLGVDKLHACMLSGKFSYVSLVDPPTFKEWSSFLEAHSVKADNLAKILIYSISHKPRFLVRLANLVGELTLGNIVSEARQLIEAKPLGRKRKRLLDLLDKPFLGISSEESRVLMKALSLDAATLGEMENQLPVLRWVAREVADGIRRDTPNPYRFEHHRWLWERNDVFVVTRPFRLCTDCGYEEPYTLQPSGGDQRCPRCGGEMRKRGFPEVKVWEALRRWGVKGSSRLQRFRSLFRAYCSKEYEKARPLIQRLGVDRLISVRRHHTYVAFKEFSGWWISEPFMRAFDHLLDTPTTEIMKKMLEQARREARWYQLFEYFKKRVPYDEGRLRALRRVFKESNQLEGPRWRVHLVNKTLAEFGERLLTHPPQVVRLEVDDEIGGGGSDDRRQSLV